MIEPFDGSVDIGNRSLYATIRGNGPVVVLNSGSGKPGVGGWDAIEPDLTQFATVVTYDRAGLGRSDPAPNPPSANEMVSDLRALLLAVEVNSPAVLLGWSLSAVMVQLYASTYPEDVAGLVLLDPTPDAPLAGFLNHPSQLQDTIRQAMLKNARHLGMDELGLPESQARSVAVIRAEIVGRSSDGHEDGQLHGIRVEGGGGPTAQSTIAGSDEAICELSRRISPKEERFLDRRLVFEAQVYCCK